MSSSVGLIWHNLSLPGVLHGGLFVMSLQCKYLVRNSDRALVIISRIDGNPKGHFWLHARECVGISLCKKQCRSQRMPSFLVPELSSISDLG